MEQVSRPQRARRSTAWALAGILAISGCQKAEKVEPPPVVEAEPQPEWERVAQLEDIERVTRLKDIWEEALNNAQKAGFKRQIAEEGTLLDPSVKLEKPSPAPGSYNCRLLRVGHQENRKKAFQRFKPFFCYVGIGEDGLLALTKQTGSDRPAGFLYENDQDLIFLGAMAKSDGSGVPTYGEDPSTSRVGVLQRYGYFKYRLILLNPSEGALLEIMELTPSPRQPDEDRS